MSTTVFVTFWLIVLARITDVTLDTIRTVAIVQGRRGFAAVLGFFEAVVYICAVAKVLLNMNHPAYALTYGLGFASGTFLIPDTRRFSDCERHPDNELIAHAAIFRPEASLLYFNVDQVC